MNAEAVLAALKESANSEDAVFLQRFFKTGEGQYGAGDVFLGVRVPKTREICRRFKTLPLEEVEKLLASAIHECRLAGVILLGNQFKAGDPIRQKLIYNVYLRNVQAGRVNNWDIVDSSAEFIIGEYLWDKPRKLLFKLAKSESVWECRVAVLSTFAFIKKGDPSTTLELAEVLLNDSHDLIQKAVGWMLREVGKRCDEKILVDFLERHHKSMPRTMLRYAIEHLILAQRAHFMRR